MYHFGKSVKTKINRSGWYLVINSPSLSVPDYKKLADEEYPQTTLYNRCIKKIAYDLENTINQLPKELYNDIDI